ncbi:MAG: MarR family transcriptional regulator [Actinomycetota bacterium]|nr:MarR family transcriptional regulator [Actinomycetota bacterium]
MFPAKPGRRATSADDATSSRRRPSDAEYERLLAVRVQLRTFDRWSREAAAVEGLTHAQHQLLLAVRGHPGTEGPTVGDAAEALLVAPHTASGLVDRTQALGLLDRERDAEDSRRVRLHLTPRGEQVLSQLTVVHLEELRRLAPVLGVL